MVVWAEEDWSLDIAENEDVVQVAEDAVVKQPAAGTD